MEGYKYLSSYILATVICDLNLLFCNKYIDKSSRTHDQMVQAGRSGKQNIAEGHTLSSLESYIKLLGVAEGSMKELAADYEDYLRQNHLETWPSEDKRIRGFREFRAIWLKPNHPNTPNFPDSPETAANMLLTFCQMETYLLSKLIQSLEEKFIKEGGFREKLFKKRLDYKKSHTSE